MKKLLIIKTGTIGQFIQDKFGDFENLICNQLEISLDQAMVVPVYEGALLPDCLDSISSVIITGSKAMVTDALAWTKYVSKWLLELSQKDIPILGICYGHQLLAHALGGVVDYHPKGEEYGDTVVQLTDESKEDKLFRGLPADIRAYVAHAQTVKQVPSEAVVLAKNAFEEHHALRFKDNVWGVQFHPEFTADLLKEYMELGRERIANQGYDVDHLLYTAQNHGYGKALLKRFVAL